MTELVGSFISIDESNKKSHKSSIQQLVDIVQSDIASKSSTTRKSYEVFASGGVNLSPIKSSLYQTVYDQDFTLGTANPLFDITIGSYAEKAVASDGTITYDVHDISSGVDAGGKLIGFADTTAMMREKVHIYKQFAHNLLGDENAAFIAPHGEAVPASATNPATDPKNINAAIFICFRRLFTRDNIYKGSFGMKLHKKASLLYQDLVSSPSRATGVSISNISARADVNSTDNNTRTMNDDKISTTNITVSPVAGEVSTLQDASDNPIGLIYYDSGIIVLDAERALDPDQIIRGLIDSTRTEASQPAGPSATTGPFYVYGDDSVNGDGYDYPLYTVTSASASDTIVDLVMKDENGNVVPAKTNDAIWYYNQSAYPIASMGQAHGTAPDNMPLWVQDSTYYSDVSVNESTAGDGKTLLNDKLYPGLWVSGTIDTVLDHICTTRFGEGNLSAISFRNETVINSSLIFCRAAPSQLNYSSNPTYTNSDGDIIAINSNREPFSFVTTIGLYDAERFLLAVAKTSRPIEKNPETDLSIRIRLDY